MAATIATIGKGRPSKLLADQQASVKELGHFPVPEAVRVNPNCGRPAAVQGNIVNEIYERERALAIRRTWMREMGIPDDEINELCNPGNVGAISLQEELQELSAVRENARISLSTEQLAEISSRSRPPAGWLD